MTNQKPSLIDTHAHLESREFAIDCDAVIARATEAGVCKIISVGTTIESSGKTIALAEKFPQIYAAVGIHPHDAANVQEKDIERLGELAKRPKVVALGEMGLDFYRNYAPHEAQVRLFKWQLELARKLSLPVIIHTRRAAAETLQILEEWLQKPHIQPPGVIHCFSENAHDAKKFLDIGFYLALGGYISYPKSLMPEVIKTIPLDRIVLETDCPFLSPQMYRGKRNEPAYIALTAESLAGILGMSMEIIARLTSENAKQVFKFK